MREVVVTGMGIVSSLGNNISEVKKFFERIYLRYLRK
jgi:3-oxoacyl-(acyl-carrier-protein) synthase